jgi:cytochrome c553
MKKVLKYLGYLLLIIITAAGILLSYVRFGLPNVGKAEVLQIEYTQERIEHGRYLANAVTLCMDCHAQRDWTKFSGPAIAGTLGAGGDVFDQRIGFPGKFYAKNITPIGIGQYTDGELYRVISTGVTKEGKALFPVMPYPYYAKMDPEDIYSIIAYIRSLEPVHNTVPESQADIPFNFIMNLIPKKAEPQKRPSKSDTIAYGAYITNAAGCIECHTNVKDGRIIPELAYSGGREFPFPDGSLVRSVNITPHVTGIGTWTEEMFVQRFKQYTDSTNVLPEVKPGEFNTVMPWTMYGLLEEDDLKAIYAYLKTVKPIDNAVERFTPAPKQ